MKTKDILHLDFETYSECNLREVGAWVYANHPSTEVLCAAYALNDEAPELWTPSDPIPWFTLEEHVGDYEYHAHNAQFEVFIWKYVLAGRWGVPMGYHQWRCTAAQAAAFALPRKLADACAVVGLPEDEQKDKRGTYLIQRLCKPYRGERVSDPELLNELYEYCLQDVIAERALGERIPKLIPHEQKVWELDQTINERGVPIDLESVENAIYLYEKKTELLTNRIKKLSGIENPNSHPQVMSWLEEQDYPLENLQASTIDEELDRGVAPELVLKVLKYRRDLARTPPKKYYKMRDIASVDGRAHGMFLYRSTHPGRWSGQFVQPHNLMRPVIDDTDGCTETYRHRDLGLLEFCYGEAMAALSSTVRSMFKAEEGKTFMACDYSAIEARLVPWQANETKVLDIFRGDGLVYERQAGALWQQDFRTVDSKQRQVGKVCVLAFGFEGGYGAYMNMAGNYGVDVDGIAAEATDEQRIRMEDSKRWWASIDDPRYLSDAEAFGDVAKQVWREENPNVVAYWKAILETALEIVDRGYKKGNRTVGRVNRVRFAMLNKTTLCCLLPSGRRIHWHHPYRSKNRWGRPIIRFMGVDGETKRWSKQQTHGGKIVQNITEGLGSDLLAGAMLRHEENGFPVVLHVHDEDVCEVSIEGADLKKFKKLFLQGEPWADGLPLNGDEWQELRYRK